MTTAAARKSYSFKDGLTMMAAKDVGIDPYLAADAGEGAKAALNHLRKARLAKNPSARAGHVRDAQSELKSISAAKHPKLVNAIQGKILALQGRGGDSEIAHVTPGEMVIPRSMQTPALMKQIAALAAQRGINPAQLSVGHRANNVNPKTGQREFNIEPGRRSISNFAINESLDNPIESIFSITYADPFNFIGMLRDSQGSTGPISTGDPTRFDLTDHGWTLSEDGKYMIGPNGEKLKIEEVFSKTTRYPVFKGTNSYDILNLHQGGQFAFNGQNVMRDANNDEIFKYGNGALTGPPSILKVPTKDELENMPDDQLKQRTELLKGIEQGVLFAGIPLTIVAVAGLVFYSNPVTGAIVGVLSALVAAQLDQVTDAYQAECASRKLC